MRIVVVGTGYVGLVTAVGLAEQGHTVTCVDIDQDKVAALNRGEPPIFERGLQTLLQRNLGTHLRATTDLAAAVADSELTFICVGTPSRPDGSIDVSYVRRAAEQIGAALAAAATGFHAVVVKSTVVPGTSDQVVRPTCERASGKRAGVDFGVGVIPSSSPKDRRSMTSSGPTASSSAATTGPWPCYVTCMPDSKVCRSCKPTPPPPR